MKDKPDRSEAQWAREAESRLAAYRRGEIRAIPLAEVLAKYRPKADDGQLPRK